MLIAYSGSHGTGKTTAVYHRAAQLKVEHPDKTVGIVSELAARCPYRINLDGDMRGQLWVFTRQISAELEMTRKYDIVVADRTALDSVAYTAALNLGGMSECMLALVQYHMSLYDEIIFNRIENNDHWHADGVRDAENVEYRKHIEATLLWYYRRLGIDTEDRFKLV